MAKFNTSDAKDQNNRGLPPGDYLLAIRSLERKTSKARKPYLQTKIEVIAGPAKGKKFRDGMSLDFGNEGASFRFALLLEQCRVATIDDTDDDNEIRRAVLNKPFKARVKRSFDGDWVNNSVERYLVGVAVTDEDRAAMDEWEANHEGEAEQQEQDDVPPPSDDDIPF